MQIHVVQPNQSLFGIAQTYGSTVEDIIEANELPNPNNLVVGQTLVIPIVGRFYFVQPGDSFWSIKKVRNYLSGARSDKRNFRQPAVTVGFRLYIPERRKQMLNSMPM